MIIDLKIVALTLNKGRAYVIIMDPISHKEGGGFFDNRSKDSKQLWIVRHAGTGGGLVRDVDKPL